MKKNSPLILIYILLFLPINFMWSFSPEIEASLSEKEWKMCSRFIETHAKNYFNNEHFTIKPRNDLPCTIEKDRKTGAIFIHLKGRKGALLGKGSFKTVTKSILYGEKPITVARCEVKQPGDFEMKVLDRMKGALGVVQSYAYIKRSPKTCDIFLQYYNFGTLNKIEKGLLSIPTSNIISIMKELLIGLKNIHERGYFHGDIKPLNVFLDKHDGTIQAVLGDFGFAWQYEQISPSSYRIHTSSGEVMTCSSEKANQKKWHDIYKLGKMFYLMLLPDEYKKNSVEPNCSNEALHTVSGIKRRAAQLAMRMIQEGPYGEISLENALHEVNEVLSLTST